jgi:hypothetical protein
MLPLPKAKHFNIDSRNGTQMIQRSAKNRPIWLSFPIIILQATICLAAARSSGQGSGLEQSSPPEESSIAHYSIRASVFIIGDIGEVGRMTIEGQTRRVGDRIEKTLRLAGHSTPEQVKKGRDIGGEFRMVKRLPVNPEGRIDWKAAENAECLHTGYLKQNRKTESEKVTIYPDRAIACREDGSEKTLQGNYGSLLSLLEYFLDNEIKVGDIHESKFILGQCPYIFRCEVDGPALLKPFNTKAYLIDVTTFDGLLRDSRGLPKVRKKKGGIRIWLSKEEPYRNQVLRMNIRYKWYLTLNIELAESGLPPPADDLIVPEAVPDADWGQRIKRFFFFQRVFSPDREMDALQAQAEHGEIDGLCLGDVLVVPEAILDSDLDGLADICQGFFIAFSVGLAIPELRADRYPASAIFPDHH